MCRSSKAVPASPPTSTTPASIPPTARPWRSGASVSTLAVPLRFRDSGVVGCLTLVEKREGRSFTDEDRELVTLLAGPAAVAVRNARLFRLQQEQNRYLASMLDTARAITSTVTLEDSLSHICRTAAEALEAEECVAYEYDPVRDAIVFRAFYGRDGRPPALDEAGVYPLDDYPADREILRRGEVVQETLSDEKLPAGRARVHGAVGREGVPQRAARRRGRAAGDPRAHRDGARAGLQLRRSGARAGARGSRPRRPSGTRGCTGAASARTGASRRCSRRAACSSRRSTPPPCSARCGARSPTCSTCAATRSPCCCAAATRSCASNPVHAAAGSGDEAGDGGARRPSPAGRRRSRARPPDEDDAGSRLVVPFVSGDTAEGLLDVRVGAALATGDDELELLQILASQAAAALANAALYRTLEHQAITDGLTGLLQPPLLLRAAQAGDRPGRSATACRSRCS